MSLRVVYAGTPDFAIPPLAALTSSRYRVLAVYTQPDRPAGRGRQLRASAVKVRALAEGLPVMQPTTLDEPTAAAALAALAPDVVVVAAYGLLLPPAMLAVPRLGCLNIHASLLPRWRGAAPIPRALLAGDAETGVAIMRMEASLDTGPVYASARLAIDTGDTAATLGARLAVRGAALLLEVLAALEAASARALPQPTAGVSYARKLEKREAVIAWTRSAAELDRQVRALVPWPVAETTWRGAQLKVHAASVLPGGAGEPPGTIVAAGASGIDVATGEGRLRLLRVQRAGRGIVSAGDFAAAESRRGPLAGAGFGVGR